jgi:hypothetical protein
MKFLRVLVASTAFVGLGTVAAHAVDVREVVEIKASPSAVWAKIGEWCAIKDWHPLIASCDASKKGFRTLTLKDGGKIVEKLTKTGPNSYSYDIVDGPLPVKNYSATLAAKADSLGSTDLTWSAKFDAKGKSDADAAGVIKGIFTAGLKNIKDTVKFDATATPAKPAAAAAGTAAAGAAAAAVTDKAAARAKAAEERRIRIEKFKVATMEKVAAAKAAIATRLKSAADASKALYEKAKTSMSAMMKPATPPPAPGTPAAAAAAEKAAVAAKAAEERKMKFEKLKVDGMEKAAALKAAAAEKAKVAADAAKAAYEKAKTAVMDAAKKLEGQTEAPKKP